VCSASAPHPTDREYEEPLQLLHSSPLPSLVPRSVLLRLKNAASRASEVAQVVGTNAVSHHPALSSPRP
jgi:hypothetical protein